MANLRNTLIQGYYDRVHLAVVSGVDHDNGTISVLFTDQFAIRDKIPIPVVAMSGDAWIRFVPQVNDVVILGLRPDDSAVVLGWQPFQYANRQLAFDENASNAAGGPGNEMMQHLKPGEIDMRSKGGGYLRLNDIGDVLIMSLAGRVQMFGREGFTELSQLGLKVTDGRSWFRFGAPFRFFPGISERELPTGGLGQPLNKPSDLRERDMRIYDGSGSLLVQESLGTVIDEQGGLELSGTTGSGSFQDIASTIKTSAAAATGFSTSVADPVSIASKLSGISDHVKELATLFVTDISAGISAVIAGVAATYSAFLTTLDSDVEGIVTGAGAIADGLDQLRGIGDVGKTLRYRLLVNKGGQQVAAYDIDEDGGIVLSSESPIGTTINANKGGLMLYAKKGVRMVAKGFAATLETIGLTSSKDTILVAGRKQVRVAGTSMVDAANTITRTAQTSIQDASEVSITLTVGAAEIEITPATININGGGTVNINGSGLVAVTAGTITLN